MSQYDKEGHHWDIIITQTESSPAPEPEPLQISSEYSHFNLKTNPTSQTHAATEKDQQIASDYINKWDSIITQRPTNKKIDAVVDASDLDA